MSNAKRRRSNAKRSGGKTRRTRAAVAQPAAVHETERTSMIHVLEATPAGEPTHAVCSQCEQHWHNDDPEFDLSKFVRTHLRLGNRYDRYMNAGAN